MQSVDEYISARPAEVQARLETMRAIIRAAAPEAEERISYQMPTYLLHGRLVYFAAFKRHIGFYPTGGAIEAFKDEAASYAHSQNTLRFANDHPLPADLIRRIVEFRVAENLRSAAGDDLTP